MRRKKVSDDEKQEIFSLEQMTKINEFIAGFKTMFKSSSVRYSL